MNKNIISYIITAILIISPFIAFILPAPKIFKTERRNIAEFPNIPEKIRAHDIENFFQGIDAFFSDRFPLRSSLLKLSLSIYEIRGDSLDMDKCYRGKDNWLFLGNSYAHCVDKLIGKISLSRDELNNQIEYYTRILNLSKINGSELFIFIGPNKSTIYPEFLPPVIIPSQQRFITPL